MSIKIAINGFGRIGRNTLRTLLQNNSNLEVIAINDIAPVEELAYLFKYDSVLGIFKGTVELEKKNLIINKHKIKIFSLDIENLPWKLLKIDVVIEATGKYTTKEKAYSHIKSGAKKVIISSPGNNLDAMFILGVNEKNYNSNKHQIISNASCTSNCLGPILKVLDKQFEIIQGFMTTVHSYTSDQRLVDSYHKDLRRSRAAGISMIPTSTKAIDAIEIVMPQLKNKLNGLSIRVPTPNVSLIDLTVELSKNPSKNQINKTIKEAANSYLKGILEYSEDPLVSCDLQNNSHSAIFDSLSTMKIENGIHNMIKIIAWYDNEWGYSSRLIDLIKYILMS